MATLTTSSRQAFLLPFDLAKISCLELMPLATILSVTSRHLELDAKNPDVHRCVRLMVNVNLRKLVLRQECSLIQGVINATSSNVSIEMADGQRLIESEIEGKQRYPITLDEQILGWVNGDENVEVIANLISRLAYREAEKRSLSKELLAQYKEISLLFKLSEKIIDCPEIQSVASLVLEEARQLLKSSHGVLLLMQDSDYVMERISSFGEGDLIQELMPLADDLIGNIVKTGRGEIVNNVSADGRCRAEQPMALMCVPLKSKESTIGAIALSRSITIPYSAQELKLLTTMSFQVASVLKALLHERQLQESRQNELILRLSSQIRESLELNIILTSAVSEIYRTLNLDRCYFLWVHTDPTPDNQLADSCPVLPDINGLEVVTEARRCNLSPLVGDYNVALVGSLAQWFCQQTLVRINNVDDLADKLTQSFLQTHNLVALLAIPIRTPSGRIGAICCGQRSPRPWSDREVSLLQAVTNQLAIALDQAEIYDQSRYTAQLAQDKAQQLATTLKALQHTQLQLIQSEKMSGIGQMVAGVAHEINNPVTFIYGNLEFVQEYVKDLVNLVKLFQAECISPSTVLKNAIDTIELPYLLEDLPETLNSMAVGTERIRDIVLSLKNFARSDQMQVKDVDIHEGIDSTLLILRHRLKAYDNFPGIEVIKRYGDLPAVACYPSQLNQVFMNLLANAIDALEAPPYASAPKITIDTQQVATDRIQIRITDNGPGIAARIRNKLFDPFFTTKDVGKGTGLGLSISYQIITERHNGSLTCQSYIGQGTTFVIEIPIYQNSAEVPQADAHIKQGE